MVKYDINVCDYVEAYIYGQTYHGSVLRFSSGGDCVELEDAAGIESHFYLSDLSEDIDSAIIVYAPKSHILIK